MVSLGDLQPVEPRALAADERKLMDRLLNEPFGGRDELRIQLADVRVVAHGRGDTRTLVFSLPPPNTPRAHADSRIPVDAVMTDDDGTDIEILLHVVDGYARELEIYRVDGAPIKRTSLDGPLTRINWKPVADNSS